MPSSTQHALLIKLRPTGPWRIGPDSGARDRVDRVYHSDTLYSAVTAAMAQLDLRDKWLEATAAAEGGPAVRFTSCFPFQGDTLFIPPPRHMWPPVAATRLRFKSTRFVPIEMVRALVEEKPLAEERWIIDPASECLLRADRALQGGPFRVAIRTSASVDRLNNGAVEVHSVAVLEFGERAGLWTLAVFRDESARSAWKHSVQAAFRLLADSGFGGERSNGFGHSQTPLFQDCKLPDLILRPPATIKAIATSRLPLAYARVSVAGPKTEIETAPEAASQSVPEVLPEAVPASMPETVPESVPEVPPEAAPESALETTAEPAPEAMPEALPESISEVSPEAVPASALETAPEAAPQPDAASLADARGSESAPDATAPASVLETAPETALESVPESTPEFVPEAVSETGPEVIPEPVAEPVAESVPESEDDAAISAAESVSPEPPAPATESAWWILSLFSPGASDEIDWDGGSYSVVTRGGRIESSAGWGGQKRLVRMISEGSVLRSPGAPRGAAPNVAPDGFPHPVFRSGHAVSIAIPWRVNL